MSKYNKLSGAVTRRLRRLYGEATLQEQSEGASWYQNARAFCEREADAFGVPVETFAALVAVLSPGCEWERNKENATRFLRAFQDGLRGEELPNGCSVYGRLALIKAESICYGAPPLEVLGGLKVNAFYECIIDPSNCEAVVVDRHARVAALGLERSDVNGLVKSQGEYHWIARHYARVASQLGVLPHQLQATCWIHHKENAIASRFSS